MSMAAMRVLLATAILLIVGLLAFSYARTPSAVIEPAIVRLVEDPTEGDIVPIDLVLRNLTNHRITIVEAGTSCGCTSLVTQGNEKLVTAIVMEPRESVPWRATVSTRSKPGSADVDVKFIVFNGLWSETLASSIQLRPKIGVAVFPTSIECDSRSASSCSSDILLLDSRSDSINEHCAVEVSDDSVVQIHTTLVAKGEEKQLLERMPPYLQHPQVKVRRRINVKITPPRGTKEGQAWILVRPAGIDVIRIPIHYNNTNVDYQVSPVRPVIVARGTVGPYGQCVLRCECGVGVEIPTQVLSQPSFISVEIGKVNKRVIEVVISLSRLPEEKTFELRLGDQAGSVVVNVPIDIIKVE